tara:strand:+ start:92 stop:988 length:897 start_codon:yes stop_codon:yes gene_type:complete
MISDDKYDYYFKNKSISLKEFNHHIDFYKKYFTILSLDEAIRSIDNNENKKNILVLTFDDGFKTNYSVVFPVLVKNNINATFFIISSCINNKNLMWRNKLLMIDMVDKNLLKQAISSAVEEFNIKKFKKNDSLLKWSIENWSMKSKDEIADFLWDLCLDISVEEYLTTKKPYLNTNQIRELISFGNQIGSHSESHPDFSKLNYTDFKNEIYNSSKFIENITEKKVCYFSYPFGRVSSAYFEKKYKSEVNPNLLFFGIKNSLNNYDTNSRLERDNVEFEYNILLYRFLLLPIIRNLKII